MQEPTPTAGALESFGPQEIALGLALALAVGGLVGLERERRGREERKSGIGGARTFPLVALLGALSSLLAHAQGVIVLLVGFGAATLLIAVGYAGDRNDPGSDRSGLTSEFAALLVFAIGALPFVGGLGLPFAQRLLLAAGLGTIVMALLALKATIHEFAATLSHEDLLATVRFALAALVALPLLPDRPFGPYDTLNPFRIGLVVVIIAGISFVGYFAVRRFGARRGIVITALAGGLVSSTAVTLTFAAKGREHRELALPCALAIALAATIMFARVLVEIAVIQPPLVLPAALPLGGMLLAGGAGCLVVWRRAKASEPADGEETKGLHNPFRLLGALRLGLVFAAVRLASAFAWDRFGESGLFVSAALAGLADVDAITISVARMQQEGLESGVAVNAVMLASVSNTLVKVVLAAVLGGRRVGAVVAAVMLPAAALGVVLGFVIA